MQGGTYINEGGELRRVGGTEDHPDGNRARDAEGVRLNRPGGIAVEQELPKDAQRRVRPGAGGSKSLGSNSAPGSGAGEEA